MALVTTVNSCYQGITGKNITPQSQLTSRIKEAVICFAIGACAYPACAAGYAVDLSLCSRITTILYVGVGNHSDGACNVDGYTVEYRRAACCAAATGTLHFFETAAGCAAAPHTEIPNASTEVQCSTHRMYVIGF